MSGLISKTECYSLLSSDRHDLLSMQLINGLTQYQHNNYSPNDSMMGSEIDYFVDVFLELFCNETFNVPSNDAVKYVTLNGPIAYLVACSSYINTDSWLDKLVTHNAPLVKILTLYSLRNRYRIPVQSLFMQQPDLASHWYAMQLYSAHLPAQRWLMDNACKLYADMPDDYRIVSTISISAGYFAITYLDPPNEGTYKQKLNAAIRRDCDTVKWSGCRNPKSIAVITRRWFPNSAVYRALYPYLEHLSNDYNLTLVHLGEVSAAVDTSIFSSVRTFPPLRNARQISHEQRSIIQDQDWMVAYFPDIGMDAETIFLGNCRLAPIQVMGYGHPVSMHGGCIDYFVAGKQSEVLSLAEQHFTERLIVLPDIGMIPVWPTKSYAPKPENDSKTILINCPWTLMKINADLVGLLREIIDECAQSVCFRFFTDLGITDQVSHCVYKRDLMEILGESNFELYGLTNYRTFLSEMAKGDMTIIPYPFGGFNTVIDSLYVGLPAITREGTYGYNRFPAALLRKADLSTLITCTREEFKAKIIQLITDPVYRKSIANQIARTDLEGKITNSSNPGAFKRAIDYLIRNHESLKAGESRKPIVIE